MSILNKFYGVNNMGKIERPKSITIIGWIIVSTAVLGILGIIINLANPVYKEILQQTGKSYYMTTVMSLVTSSIAAIAGAAILNRKNWGRILIITIYPLTIIVLTFANGFEPVYVLSILFAAILTYFLTRKKANDFFNNIYTASAGNSSTEKPESAANSTGDNNQTEIIPDPSINNPVKPISILRNVTGIIFIVIGCNFMISLPMILFMMIDDPMKDKLFSIILTFILLSVIPLAIGILIRGIARWKMSLGVPLAVTGGMLIMVAVTIPLSMMSPGWDIAMQSSQPSTSPEMMEKIIRCIIKGSAIFGVLYSIPGGLLIYSQNKISKLK